MLQIIVIIAGIYVIIKRRIAVSSKSYLEGKDAVIAGVIIVLFGIALSSALNTDSLPIIGTFFLTFILVLSVLIIVRKKST